jgi:inner membrane transporter RhtA
VGPLFPIAALLVAMVSLQFGASLAEGLFPAVGAQGTTALRLAVASIILAAVFRPWRSLPPRRSLPALAGYGIVLGAMNLCFYMALRTIPLGIAVATEFAGPLVVSVLASRKPSHFLWIGLAAAGILLLCRPFQAHMALDPTGIAYALGAATFWAFYILFGTAAGAALGSQATALGTAIAAAIVLPLGIAHAGAALLAVPVLKLALLVGIFSSALPYSLEMVALTRMSPRVYGTLTSLEPAIGGLMGLAFLGQHLASSQWAGIAIVVAAALGAAATGDRPPLVVE